MTVSLLEIMAAARGHAAPLAAESAGYLLLAVADQVVAAPRRVTPGEIELFQDGSVRLGGRSACAPVEAEQTLRRLLARVLEVSSSVGPGLRRAGERRDETGLAGLVRELEVALIPVNRGAARRALSRLHRETQRARETGKLASWLAAESAVTEAKPSEPVIEPPADVVEPPPAAVVEPPPAAAVEPSAPAPVALPLVVAAPAPRPLPPPVELTLTPLPRAVEVETEIEAAMTRPEPVVLRAKERGSSTPRLGTVVTVQTLAEEEAERTEQVPPLAVDGEARAAELDIEVALELNPEVEPEPELDDALTPVRAVTVATEPQPLEDPEPSGLPDVVSAMLELHTGLDADEAPTRLRDVVTELLAVVQPVPLFTPEPQQVEDAWLTQSSLEDVTTASEPEPELELDLDLEPVDPALHEMKTWHPPPVTPSASLESESLSAGPAPSPEPEPEPERVELVLHRFESEQAEPELHDALTWYPAEVTTASPLPPELLIGAPGPEPSPYAPAVLPSRSSDVSELVDSFYVSGANDDSGELRSALKEMAGIELTPLPRPFAQER